jgi:hypothetical protein
MVLVSVILIFLLFAIFIATEGSVWTGVITKAPQGILDFPGTLSTVGAATLLGAIAFAGAGGANNLVQSNYVRDKGLGMGARIPNIVSPITGEEEAAPGLGYTFPTNEENMRRWKRWWKICNQEQFFLFYVIGLLSLIALSVLAYSTLGIQKNVTGDLTFIKDEGNVLGEVIAPWFATFFFAAASIKLFSTNLGILDWVSRLTADSLKVSFLGESRFWSESKIYLSVVWMMITIGSVIILTGIEPVVLLIIASSGGGFVMALYSTMLIVLNRRALPDEIRLKGWRLPIIAVTALLFISLSLFLLFKIITNPTSLA